MALAARVANLTDELIKVVADVPDKVRGVVLTCLHRSCVNPYSEYAAFSPVEEVC